MAQEYFLAEESTAQGARRILLSELDGAIDLLGGAEPDVNEAVHEARKRIKRVRALLRLLRKPLGPAFARESSALRDTAQRLSAPREAAAAVEALQLLEVDEGSTAAGQLATALAELKARAPTSRASIDELLLGAASELRRIRQRTSELTFSQRGWKLLERGFRDGYRRARGALKRARRRETAVAFHELRKAVKNHQHQLQLFEPAWPKRLERQRKGLADLSELLGQHHDLALLAPDLRNRGLSRLAAAAERQAAKLEQHILRDARELLSERPRRLARKLSARFGRYQKAAAVAV